MMKLKPKRWLSGQKFHIPSENYENQCLNKVTRYTTNSRKRNKRREQVRKKGIKMPINNPNKVEPHQ